MTLTYHFHPLASYCHKVLIALYENQTPFEPVIVDLGNTEVVAAFRKISPLGKMPALVDAARGRTVWESTVLIEYLDVFYPGATRFLPDDPDQALQVRAWDRFYDLYVHDPMQRIVGDRLRPEGQRDADAVARAKAELGRCYDVLEREMATKTWAAGEAFSLADCAAAPALFYANIVAPFAAGQGRLADYLTRLMARPSYARALDEAKPYFRYYPFEPDLYVRYPALGGGA